VPLARHRLWMPRNNYWPRSLAPSFATFRFVHGDLARANATTERSSRKRSRRTLLAPSRLRSTCRRRTTGPLSPGFGAAGSASLLVPRGLRDPSSVPTSRDDIPRAPFVAVPVNAFPYAHAPFRCDAHLPSDPHRHQRPGVIGDPTHCGYHRSVDWLKLADRSVAALEQAGSRASFDALVAACDWGELSGGESQWLYWLFADPITWRPGAERVTNGQHRLCGLRAAGARRVVADTS
jgi:hypothetical protein